MRTVLIFIYLNLSEPWGVITHRHGIGREGVSIWYSYLPIKVVNPTKYFLALLAFGSLLKTENLGAYIMPLVGTGWGMLPVVILTVRLTRVGAGS